MECKIEIEYHCLMITSNCIVSNRVISSAINKTITSHEKEKEPKSYRVRKEMD